MRKRRAAQENVNTPSASHPGHCAVQRRAPHPPALCHARRVRRHMRHRHLQ